MTRLKKNYQERTFLEMRDSPCFLDKMLSPGNCNQGSAINDNADITVKSVITAVRLSMLTPAGRILNKFRVSLDTAVELATSLTEDDPAKMELLQALHHHLCILKEDVKDNMKQTLLSSVIVEDFEENSEYGVDGEKVF